MADGPGAAGDREWEVQSLFHFTVEVTDFERSLDFYTTLGFRVLRDNRELLAFRVRQVGWNQVRAMDDL